MPESVVHLSDVNPRPAMLSRWETIRNQRQVHWLVECFAEATGVFFYTFAGVGSTAPFILGNLLKVQGLSSLLQIGFGYMTGILLAIVVCGPTSGAHFSPCVTIAYVMFKGFPPLKGLRYIIAQIFGAYVACALVYSQYKPLIEDAELILKVSGKFASTQFTPNGPAGIFALYLLPQQTLGRVLLNEFVVNIFLGLTIWAAIDPSNPLIPPSMAPVVVSLAYASAIWGFATSGIALNSARDVGARLFAMTIWGTDAAGGTYAAIAALTNIPAVLLAGLLYELFLTDSDRVVPKASLEFISYHVNHKRNRTHNDRTTNTLRYRYPDPANNETHIDPEKSLGYEHREKASS